MGTKSLPRIYFKEWREFRAMSQIELARRIGVTSATVSRIENGKRVFTSDYLFAFVEIIGCPNPGDPVNRPPDPMRSTGNGDARAVELYKEVHRRAKEIGESLDRPPKKR